MLEITGNDIAELNDTDLRTLIGLLCEAELTSLGLPIAGVTWGGHQNASDGGVDVRVDVDTLPQTDGYIPRANTAFQVKKPDMPRAAITKEMRPKGVLQKFFSELAESYGAYIIVSSQGSTADSALSNRKNAMRNALDGLFDASNIKVDFYDRERVAGWLRSHPAMILWVRDKLGRPIHGWKPYENWANCPNGINEEYLCDDQIRLFTYSTAQDGMSGIQGLNVLRNSLSVAASSVRLTGLSGVGKTRLLQAMFDERIGDNPLNQSQVFYTDISDSPNPSPTTFLEQLITLKKPAVLIIDNCPPELHRRLTSLNSGVQSLVSLITVEYDVREDQPEETEVFHLKPSSDELIEKVIRARFPYVNQVDARTIAKFSGGNARVAIALASTVQKGESLSNLKDNDLFERLFRQRHKENNDLLKAAEVCSLVYSFECNTDEGSDLELLHLSALAGMSVRELYGHISELKRRDLIQQRSVWRAVLPQALANRLAKRALENIPYADITLAFERGESERLLKSFSRRLGYLHDSQEAKTIARKWLSDDGLLGDVSNLNSLGIELLKNIAPVEPEATLLAIEKAAWSDTTGRFLTRKNTQYIEFTYLLRSLAYDEELFKRSIELLIQFALSESPKENTNSVRGMLKSLFHITLSGTHATAEQRLQVVSELIKSDDDRHITLAFELLGAALGTRSFSSHYGFDFGARSRDHGFRPKSRKEEHHWYKLFIDFLIECASIKEEYSRYVKFLLAKHFQGLWVYARMYDELENVVRSLTEQSSWNEGWTAIKSTLNIYRQQMPEDIAVRLNRLSESIMPTSLIERARLYAFPSPGDLRALEDALEDEKVPDVEKRTRLIGQEVVKDQIVLYDLMPELLSRDGYRLYSFGQGIADECKEPLQLWKAFKHQLRLIEPDNRRYNVIVGFLRALEAKNLGLLNELLDNAVTDEVFAEVFPILQTSVVLDKKAVTRLVSALNYGKAPVQQYLQLAYGRIHETISDNDLCKILRLILTKDDGALVALEIASMRLHNNPGEVVVVSTQMATLGQEIVMNIDFTNKYNPSVDYDHNISQIVELCFRDASAANTAKMLCIKLAHAFASYQAHEMNYTATLLALAKAQSIVFLDSFLGEETGSVFYYQRTLFEEFRNESNPLSGISDEMIITWAELDPMIRYVRVAAAIRPYTQKESETKLKWTPLAKHILQNACDPVLVLSEFKKIFSPTSWSGSLAELMQHRLPLITELKEHETKIISDWAKKIEIELQKEIMDERKREMSRDRRMDERFE